MEFMETFFVHFPPPINPLPTEAIITSPKSVASPHRTTLIRTPTTSYPSQDSTSSTTNTTTTITPESSQRNPTSPTSLENKAIINLSTINLSKDHYQLLLRGLTFIPTATMNANIRESLDSHLQMYHRRLKLAVHFDQTNTPSRPPFHLGSSWEPNDQSLPDNLLRLITKDRQDLSNLTRLRETPNLSSSEIKALRELQNHPSIVIKPADKGSTVVIMDKTSYIREAHRQLLNTNYYQKLDQPIYPHTATRINTILDQLKTDKYLTKKQVLYLKGQTPSRPRRFYLLPKIHKSPESWPIPFRTPPGRPIVSDCGSESYGSAEFIDHWLTPLSINHPSYVKDTNDFVTKVKTLNLTEPCFLFSMDVENLYTNIDTSMGMEAVREILQTHPNPKRPDQALLELLHINLTCNDFVFNKQYFLQVKGTAMGKKFSPAYANIYMAKWEKAALQKCPKQPLSYLRFLDDIWGIWTHTKKDFNQFVEILNNHHPSIKLTPTLHESEINFLDTTTYKGPLFQNTGLLDIRIYFKPTDSHALLYRTSFHPQHTFKGIIRSQLLRFKRICTQKEDLESATKTLFQALRKRGYSRSFLRKIQKNTLEQNHQIQETNTLAQTEKPLLPIVSVFSSFGIRAHQILKRNFHTIMGNSQLYSDYKLISAYKKNPNLRDLLVQAQLKDKQTSNYHLGRKTTGIKNRQTGIRFPIQKNLDFATTNCVYLLRCHLCGSQYVGETKNSIKIRLQAHRHQINRGLKHPTILVKHFRTHGISNLRAVPLESQNDWSDNHRRKIESMWIKKLNCRYPHGLNDPCR